MNKSFSVTLMVLSVIAIAATLFLRRADATVLNQNFSIETLYGNPSLIDDVFEISAIRQEGTNSFSRVVLTTNEPEITPITFDLRHHIDDRQLEMREFYRGTQWWTRESANRIETENFHVMVVENWPSRETFNILNKETNLFVNVENTTDRGEFIHWTFRLFMEKDGILYVAIVGEDEPKARFYEVDFERGALNFLFSVQQENSIGGRWLLNANGIHFYQNGGWDPLPSGATGGWNPERGEDTLTTSNHPFYIVNFETQSFELRPTPIGISSWGWGWDRMYWQDYVIREGIATYDDDGMRGYFDGITLNNLETGHRHVFHNTLVDDWFESQQGYSLSAFHWSEIHVIDNYLVETTRINEFLQFITIYDLNTTMTQIYHGRINIRRDQGLLTNNWRGGEIDSFEVRLRD